MARFAARYHSLGFKIASETLALMTELALSGELQHLTAERVWLETEKSLKRKKILKFILKPYIKQAH